MLERKENISATSLAEKLHIHRGTASRRVGAAIRGCWLVNQETRSGLPWKLEIGEPLPETAGLPDPETVAGVAGVADPMETAQQSQPDENTEDIPDCCTVAGNTDIPTPSPVDELEDIKEVNW